ncbi:DUF4422 domain-containing protein [Paenibacillus rhizophilus]|uniref:DUF4422 domain-containing protein n=1 Tax=Paenibacillus rhizophilus TaxID=1850366 RepID=A0A3N9PBN8_9BACL|nr:DUF4422 domain-containing protein [Paenibacillus rhizophilus]RQW12434.1 DUF4422 domain-containing protein [Paenibacillus rhizophilus]
MKIKILVATHKKYEMPSEGIYTPIHVGREGRIDLGYQGDNTGDNISSKNSNYCELTAIYWAWKNVTCDIIGLCHYRRYFSINNSKLNSKLTNILNEIQIIDIMKNYDIIMPQKVLTNKHTVESHYIKYHRSQDLKEIRNILSEKYPIYLNSFDKVMSGKELYLFNMFITNKNLFNEYSNWLFDILFELEMRLDISSYDRYQQRIFGFLSERLFNVWLVHRNLKIKEVPVINLEPVEFSMRLKRIPKKIKMLISKKILKTNERR